jgi:hypothetical protein
MTSYRINYRKVIREVFKTLCITQYPTKATLSVSEVHSEIQKRISAGGRKISNILEPYIIREEEGLFYRNPYVYDVFDTLLNLPYYFTNPLGTKPPTGITGPEPEAEEMQREYGRTFEEASRIIEKGIGRKVHDDILRVWVEKKHKDKIRKGVDGYYYVVPD